MYLSYYNLNKQPFHITPDPEFLYLSPSHKEALAAIIYGVEQKKGFVAITGDVGVGKTTILRSYLDNAKRSNLKIVYIFNARLSFEDLILTIYQELQLSIESTDIREMINRLYEILIKEYEQGNTVVLVIDEAQNMPVDTLENLRMLSNLETSKDKLLQIVLVGQPEFEEELDQSRLRQLKQRLAIRAKILPLTKNESNEYIKFRLNKAGSTTGAVFSEAALKLIVKKAQGVPRVINTLCDNALITGLGYREKPIARKTVKEIIYDFEGKKQRNTSQLLYPVAALILLCFIGLVWLVFRDENKQNKLVVSQERRVPQVLSVEGNNAKKNLDREEPLLPGEDKNEDIPSAKKNEHGVIQRTVAPGDTLSKLAREVYGILDERLVERVREENRQITNPDVIHPGSVIVFPDVHGNEHNKK